MSFCGIHLGAKKWTTKSIWNIWIYIYEFTESETGELLGHISTFESDVGRVMRMRLSCCLVLMSINSMTGNMATAPPQLDAWLKYLNKLICTRQWFDVTSRFLFYRFLFGWPVLFSHILCLFVTHFHMVPLFYVTWLWIYDVYIFLSSVIILE